MRSLKSVFVLSLLVLGTAPGIHAQDEAVAQEDALARGDAAWERRHEGQEDGRASAGPIGEAVAAYEEALAAAPESLEVHWKLLRALHFQGDYTTDDREEKKRIFGRGKEVAESALDLLATRVGGREALDELEPAAFPDRFSEPGVAEVYFWAAANWGLWGENYGKMAAARQGVAKRVRDYAEVVIALDPDYDQGGGYRVLGRLHTEAPKIPFITGWVDHQQAITDLRRAVEIGPEVPDGPFFLADALLRFGKKGADAEALTLLRELVVREPRPEKLTEDLATLRKARALLAEASR